MGPFTIVKSIDSLTETLADILPAGGRGFSLSTKNIGKKKIFEVLDLEYKRQSFSEDQSSRRQRGKKKGLRCRTLSSQNFP